MRTSRVRAARLSCIAAIAASVVAACGTEPGPRPAARPAVTAKPTAEPVATSEPEPEGEKEILKGIDTSALNDKGAELFEELVNELPAPCDDVKGTIAECVTNDLDCAACAPAAEIIAHTLEKDWRNKDWVISVVQERFSKDVKKFDLTDSPSRGPADAPVTVIVWRDLLADLTNKEMEDFEKVLDRHPNDVRVVHKFISWPQIDTSPIAARAAVAAHRQGKFWEMAKVLFAYTGDILDVNKVFMNKIAKDLGLDMKRYAKDFGDPKTAKLLARDQREADAEGYGIKFISFSFVFVNGRHVELSTDEWRLEHWISSEIKIVRREREKQALEAKKRAREAEEAEDAKPSSRPAGSPKAQ